MTSSDRTPSGPSLDALPPALSSMWRLCRLGYQHEPGLMLAAFVLSQLAALPDALLAVWLKLLGAAVLAIPTVVTSTWRPAVERVAQERAASANRLARHLFTTATTASPGKEVRVTGIGPRLVDERRAAWERGHGPVAAVRWRTAAWH